MSVEENKKLVHRYYDEMWNRWDFTVANEIINEAIVFRGSLGVTTKGRDGFKQYMSTVRAAFPDFHNVIEDLIAEGDKVVALLTYTGTHQVMLFSIAPTGRHVQYSGTAIFRIEANQIVSGWVMGDTLGLLQQLGAVASLDGV
jgi:predicted ester cyclase